MVMVGLFFVILFLRCQEEEAEKFRFWADLEEHGESFWLPVRFFVDTSRLGSRHAG